MSLRNQCAVVVAVISMAGWVLAGSLQWDGNGATAPNPNGGSGTWDVNTTANWWNGASNVVWPAPGGTDDDAVFGATAGTVSIAAGGVIVNDMAFTTSGYTIQGNSLTLNGAGPIITVNGNARIDSAVTNTSSNTTLTGPGALTLGGTVNFTGRDLVSNGTSSTTTTLNVVSGAAIAAGNLYIRQQSGVGSFTGNYNQTGGTVNVTGEFGLGNSTTGSAGGNLSNATISGGTLTVSGTLSLYKWATSNLTVSGAGVVNAASLRLGWVDSSPTGTMNLGDGSTFSGGTSIHDGGTSGILNVTSFSIYSNRSYTLNFMGGTLKAGSSSTTWLPAGTFTTASVQDAGGILDNGGNSITIGQVLAHGGVAATDGGLVFKGSGTTTLSSADTYNGGTTVSQGQLTLTNAAAAGTGLITLGDAATGATNIALNFNVGSGTLANPITVSSLGSGTVTLNEGVAYSTLTGLITLNRPTMITGGGSDRVDVSGKITGPVGTLTVAGAPRVTMGQSAANASDFTGNVVVSAGTLQLNSPYALPSTAGVTVNSGAIFRLVSGTGSVVAIDALNGPGNINGDTGGGNYAKTLSVGNNNGSGSYGGVISNGSGSDTVALIKNGTGTQTLTGANTFTGGTTINAGTLQVGNGTTNGSLSSNILNNTSLVLNMGTATTPTLSGAISGPGTVTKIGPGAVILSGAGNYTGATTISAGTLQLNNTTAAGASAITLGDAGTGAGNVQLTLNAANIANNVTVSNNGTGTATLYGSAQYTGQAGALVLNRATILQIPSTGAGADWWYSFGNGGISGSGPLILKGGSGGNSASDGGNRIVLGAGTYTGGTIIESGKLQLQATPGSGPITLGDANTGSAVTQLRVGTTVANNIVISSLAPGSAAAIGTWISLPIFTGGLEVDRPLTLEGAGDRMTWTGASALWSGSANITVSGGRVTHDGVANTWTGNMTINSGATFQAGNPASLTAANSVTANGVLRLVSGAGSTLTIGALNGTGAVNGDTGGGNYLKTLATGAKNGNDLFSGVISNGGGGDTLAFTKIGTGTQTLTGSNTYTGATTVSDGMLTIGGGGRLGSGAYAGAISLAAGTSTLNYNSSAAQTFSGPISGSGRLIQSGPGTLTLSGNSSYSGGTTISAGTLQVNTSSAAGTGAITLGDANTGANEVRLNMPSNTNWPPTILLANPINVSSQAGGRAVLAGVGGTYAAEFQGTITLQNKDLVIRNEIAGDRTSIEGKITGTGNVTIECAGGRVNWDNPANDFAGNLTLTPGAFLQLNGAVIPDASDVLNNGLMRFNTLGGSFNETIGALSGNGLVEVYWGNGTVGLAVGSNNHSGTFSGVIQNGSGVMALTKVGTGIQTLSGNSTYTGATTVNAGKLLIDGSITSPVTVNGGMLGGNGRITGAVTVGAAGAISAGDSPGHLTITGNYVQSGTMLAELGGLTQGTTYDWIDVGGTATFNSGAIVNVSAWNNWPSPGEGIPYYVLTATGGITNNDLSGITFDFSGKPVGPGDWKASIVPYPAGGSNAEALMLEAVPEPATMALLGAGIAGLGGYLRRRRNGK